MEQRPLMPTDSAPQPAPLDVERLRAALSESFDSEDGFEWRTPGTLDEFTQEVAAEYARLSASTEPQPTSLDVERDVERDVARLAEAICAAKEHSAHGNLDRCPVAHLDRALASAVAARFSAGPARQAPTSEEPKHQAWCNRQDEHRYPEQCEGDQ